ncbi:MAG: winged helix-turn-helix domain-containing protein, partial [Acidobacteriota bacterium]|nr:winged helix-turn-helix domain-containing protein [Acidobacteriota bacterium]
MKIVPQRKIYEFARFRVDAVECFLLDGNNVVSLTPKVFDTLLMLIENQGHILSKEEMLAEIWHGAFVEENNLAQNISILRKSLGKGVIETVPKRGYRFAVPVRLLEDERNPSPLVIHEKIRARILIDDESENAKTNFVSNLISNHSADNKKLTIDHSPRLISAHQPETHYVENGDVNIAY